MLSGRGRGAAACAALVAVLLLFAVPNAAGAAVAADEGTASSDLEYFLGDLIQEQPVNKDLKALPRFRPWRIFNVSGDGGVLVFDCTGDVPTLCLVPRSDHPEHGVDSIGSGTPPPVLTVTCGGGPQAGTPVEYKFISRRDKPTAVYSALFWARPSTKNQDSGAPAPLMPLPKLQLKAILKALATMMEAAWRNEMGQAMPETVPFPADMVAFYVKELGSLLIMGREDVEFHKPWKKLDGKISSLTLRGTVV